MAKDSKMWFVRTDEGRVYGPANIDTLKVWSRDGRIDPTGFLSTDRINWMPAQLMAELEMKWLIETEPGHVFGPFNRTVVSKLMRDGGVPKEAKVYRLHEFSIDEDAPPKIVEKEVIKEVPVEKIVIKEVPVEKIVEKVVEVQPPARTELVVAEVVEPEDKVPPVRSPGAIFNGMDRNKLAALEAAAQRELAKGRRFGIGGGFFGRKY